MAYIPLTIRESDASPTAGGVSEIIVTNTTLTTGTGRSVTIATGAASTGGGTLTVAEADGSPSVSSVTKLVASSAFTVTDDSSGQVTLALGASSGTAGAMVLISDVTSTAAVASIAFTSIPGTYKSLMIHLQGRGDSTAATTVNLLARFNSDTGTNYDWQRVSGNGASAGSSGATAQSSIQVAYLCTANSPANTPGAVSAIVPNYAGVTYHKQILSEDMIRFDTSNTEVDQFGGNWRSTAAITDISLFPSAGNFLTGSRATLWGMQ